MNPTIFETYEQMCLVIAEEIIADLNKNPRQLLCIAAGNTSLGIFDRLVQAYQEGRISFSQASFVSMDEWMFMNSETPGSCGNFLVKYFLSRVDYPSEQVFLWDGCKEDTGRECKNAEAFIAAHGTWGAIDYLVLGAGMNGHLALNEPGTPFSSTAHVTQLDQVTQQVGQKYFDSQVVLKGGITLGIGNFRQARRTVLAVNGSHKASVVQKLVQSKTAAEDFPATALLNFPNASFYCDALAGETGA